MEDEANSGRNRKTSLVCNDYIQISFNCARYTI